MGIFVVGKTRSYFRMGALEYLEANRTREMGSQVVSLQRYIRGWFIRKDHKQADNRRRKAIAKIQKWYTSVTKQIAAAERAKKAAEEKRKKQRRRKPWKPVLRKKRPSVRHELQEKRQKRKNVKDWKEKRKRREGRRKWKLSKSSRRTSKRELRSTRRKSKQRKSPSMRRTKCGMLRSTILKRNVKKLNGCETKSWRKSQQRKPSSQRFPNYPIKTRRSSRIVQKLLPTFVRITRRCDPRQPNIARITTPCKKTTSDCWKPMRTL